MITDQYNNILVPSNGFQKLHDFLGDFLGGNFVCSTFFHPKNRGFKVWWHSLTNTHPTHHLNGTDSTFRAKPFVGRFEQRPFAEDIDKNRSSRTALENSLQITLPGPGTRGRLSSTGLLYNENFGVVSMPQRVEFGLIKYFGPGLQSPHCIS